MMYCLHLSHGLEIPFQSGKAHYLKNPNESMDAVSISKYLRERKRSRRIWWLLLYE